MGHEFTRALPSRITNENRNEDRTATVKAGREDVVTVLPDGYSLASADTSYAPAAVGR